MKYFTMFILAASLSSPLAFADDTAMMKDGGKKMMMPNMTMEQRQKMADAHDMMASCMRSDKPMSECQDTMMKSCEEGMGKDGCKMMMMGHQGKGMRHHMSHPDTAVSKAKK